MADKSSVYEITSFRGALSDYEDKGIPGAFKFGTNLDVRKIVDSLSAGQALKDLGVTTDSPSPSASPSASTSPSASASPSPSASISPSASLSPSPSPSSSISPSASKSPSASSSPSASTSPSSSVSPSVSPSAGLLSVISDLIMFFVPSSDGNIYAFGNTGKIYKIDSDQYVSQVYDAGQGITGASEWYSDSGKTYLYFATRTSLHRKELPGLSNWNDVNIDNDWPKNNLTSADWHTMREAGGSLIIANGPSLALVGYDESYTNNALDLIPGNIAKTIVERNGRTIVGTSRASDPNRGVNGAIDSEVPLSQVGDDGEIFFSNMTDSVPVKRFPGGGKVNPGGVANMIDQVNTFEWEQNALSWIDKQAVGNLALFGVYNADSGKSGVYSYGRKNKNHPFVLNLDYQIDADEIGAVINVGGLTYVSYRDGSDFGLRVTDSTLKATGTYEGLDFKAPVKKPTNITHWMHAELYFAPLPDGASIEFWYKLNKTGSFVQASTADGSASYSTADGQKAVFIITGEAEIFEPRIVLNPTGNSTPEVHRIRVYFS